MRWNGLRKLSRGESGSAALELAFALPILVLVTVGIFDVGMAFQQRHRLAGAAQGAALMAVQNTSGEEIPETDLEQRVRDDAEDTGNLLTVDARYYCSCPGETAEVVCTAVCPTPRPPSRFVEVRVQDNYTMVLDYPGLPDAIPFDITTTMRIR